MITVTVSIGRNVKGKPMSAADWSDFQRIVRLALHAGGSDLVFDGVGGGIWEGVFEQSATFITVWPDDYWHANVKFKLANIADANGQDAIAWTAGVTEFLSAGTDRGES